MNRSQFIRTIMELYPGTFKQENKAQYQGWINRYQSAIGEDWDFEKLLKIFDREWKSTVVPPHPSFFIEFKSDVKPSTGSTYHPEHLDISEEEQKVTQEKIKEHKERFKKLIDNMRINQIRNV